MQYRKRARFGIQPGKEHKTFAVQFAENLFLFETIESAKSQTGLTGLNNRRRLNIEIDSFFLFSPHFTSFCVFFLSEENEERIHKIE